MNKLVWFGWLDTLYIYLSVYDNGEHAGMIWLGDNLYIYLSVYDNGEHAGMVWLLDTLYI